MKHIILTLIFILCSTLTFAQKLAVESFSHDEMNLEARLDGGRTDLNGKQCALVKVMVRDNIMKCKGGNVGDIVADGIVKKIFVSPSARFLELEFQYNFPLKVTFADYGYAKLTEGSTYTVTLVDAYLLSQQPAQPQNQPQSSISSAQNQVAIVTTSPQEAPSNTSTTDEHSLNDTLDKIVNELTNMFDVSLGVTTFEEIKKRFIGKEEKDKDGNGLTWITKDGTEFKDCNETGVIDLISINPKAYKGTLPEYFDGINLNSSYDDWNSWFVRKGFEYQPYKPYYAEQAKLFYQAGKVVLMFDGRASTKGSMFSLFVRKF